MGIGTYKDRLKAESRAARKAQMQEADSLFNELKEDVKTGTSFNVKGVPINQWQLFQINIFNTNFKCYYKYFWLFTQLCDLLVWTCMYEACIFLNSLFLYLQ